MKEKAEGVAMVTQDGFSPFKDRKTNYKFSCSTGSAYFSH